MAQNANPRTQMLVERASVEDAPAVAELFNMYRVFYGCQDDLASARQFLTERLRRKESTILLAREIESDRVVGFTQLYPMFSSIRLYRTLVLNDLFVHPDVRQRGVGRLLMNAAAEYARECGVRRIELETRETNTAAQALYESLGYVRGTGFYNYSLAL